MTRPRFRSHPVEFVLTLFGEVRPGEAPTVLLLACNVFLLLTAYYLLKVAREPLILLGGGAEVKSYAAVGQSILLVFVANFYGWLAARVGRIVAHRVRDPLLRREPSGSSAPLGLRGVPLGVPFFLWVGIFNLVTVAQFWSFAADIYTEEQGKRLFPIIGIGSSVGAVGGAALAEPPHAPRLAVPSDARRRGDPRRRPSAHRTSCTGARRHGVEPRARAVARRAHRRAATPSRSSLRDRYLLLFAVAHPRPEHQSPRRATTCSTAC